MSEPLQPGAVKSGWRTTEFWQTLFVQLLAAVAALGTVFHTHFNLNGVQAAVPAASIFAAAVAQSFYSHSRATVKSSAQAAGARTQQRAPDVAAGSPAAPIIVRLTGAVPDAHDGGERPAGRPH